MKSQTHSPLNKTLAMLIATLAMTACSHHSGASNDPQATDMYVGTENIQSNADYRGQLTHIKRESLQTLLQAVCGDECRQFSENATVDFAVNPANENEGKISLTFASSTGDAPLVITRTVEVHPNRRGESLTFSSTDLSGRLSKGWRLQIASRDGLIGMAVIATVNP